MFNTYTFSFSAGSQMKQLQSLPEKNRDHRKVFGVPETTW